MSYIESQKQTRNNYHLANQHQKPLRVHLLKHKRFSSTMSVLKKQINDTNHQNIIIFEYDNVKLLRDNLFDLTIYHLVIIEANSQDAFDTQQYYFSENDHLKIFTYSKKVHTLPFPVLSTPFDVITKIRQILNIDEGGRKKIKLKSVNIFDIPSKSKDGKINTNKSLLNGTARSYEHLYFQKTEKQSNQKNYEEICDLLEGQNNIKYFHNTAELMKIYTIPKNKKHLLMVSVNQSKLIKQFQDKIKKVFDVIFFGSSLNPANQLSEDYVVLATSDRLELINFLMSKGFVTKKMEMEQQIQAYNRPLNSNDSQKYAQSVTSFRTTNLNGIQQKIIKNWIVDKPNPQNNVFETNQIVDNQHRISLQNILPENQEKKKVKRLKSPTKTRLKQEDSIQNVNNGIVSGGKIEQRDQLIRNKTNIPNYNINVFETNQMPKEENQNKIESISWQQSKNGSFNDYNISKRSIGIDKYRNPSNVITQLSDQYRGSNKSQIVNLEPDNTKNIKTIGALTPTYHMYRNDSANAIGQQAKKISSGSLSYTHNSDPNRFSSASSHQQFFKIYPNQEENMNLNQGDRRVIASSGNSYPIKSGIINQTDYSSKFKNEVKVYRTNQIVNSPSKVIRKEIVSPPAEYKVVQRELNGRSNEQINQINQLDLNKKSIYQSYFVNGPQNNFQNGNRIVDQRNEVNTTKEIEKYMGNNPINQPNYDHRNTQSYNSPPRVSEYRRPSILDDPSYERFQENGRIIYRKKNISNTTNQLVSEKPRINMAQRQINQNIHSYSPQVRKYQASPLRIDPISNGRSVNYENLAKLGSVETNKYNIESYYRTHTDHDHNLHQIKPILVDHMIESSHKNKSGGQGNQYQYRYEEVKRQIVNNPKTNTLKMEVQRRSKLEPRVESPNIKLNLANESNMFSRLSELHSDGSILRRNNIRFGINLYKDKKVVDSGNLGRAQQNLSLGESKLSSGLTLFNKKFAINQVIKQQEIEDEKERYIHINPRFNSFHFIIEDERSYLSQFIKKGISSNNDRVQQYNGMDQLFEKIRSDRIEDKYDVGFVFTTTEEAQKINTNLFPEDYYIVVVQKGQEGSLVINRQNKQIRMNEPKLIRLAQKIILDTKIYQYVIYHNNKKQIQQLADKFLNSQFQVQKIQTNFTTQILDSYYSDFPRLTRLYILCDESELSQMFKIINIYAGFSPNFNKNTCKIICFLSKNQILAHQELIEKNPHVFFISNLKPQTPYFQILRDVHYNEEEEKKIVPLQTIFYHQNHKGFKKIIQKQFPGRFKLISFDQYSEVEKMTEKGHNILVLHEQNGGKIKPEMFKKVYMLGKSRIVQSKILRVLNISELVQLLRK